MNHTHPQASGYRLYRWTEASNWQPVNPSQLLTETFYVEERDIGKSVRLYAVASVNASGQEGEASKALSLSFSAASINPTVGPSLVFSGDYNGDGRMDLIWHHGTTGQVYGMLLDGYSIAQQGMVYTESNTAWQIVGKGNFDGNRTSDLIWWNNQTGQVYEMLMNGLIIAGGAQIYQEPNTAWQIVATAWQIVAVGDLNGDSKEDLIWWNNSSGQVYGMLMEGTGITQGGMIYTSPRHNL